MIYLKELHRDSQDRLKAYGQYFQYSLMNYKNFPNSTRSRSEDRDNLNLKVTKAALVYEKLQLRKSMETRRGEYLNEKGKEEVC